MRDEEFWTPMRAETAVGVITVENVSSELERYIKSKTPNSVIQVKLQAQYENLAEQVMQFAVNTYNRVVRYVRDYLGQHWVQEINMHQSIDQQCLQFNCYVILSDSSLLHFYPSSGKPIRIKGITADDEHYINAKRWTSLRAFVESGKRSSRFRTLLTDAEEIAASGHSRAAIVEAVTALEVALSEFSKAPNAEQLYGNKLSKRMEGASLKRQVEKMGLEGGISFLLPVLIPESKLSTEVVEGCREAIRQRNNVVHNGQREVKPKVWKNCLESIRSCCLILEELTKFGDASDVTPETQVNDE